MFDAKKLIDQVLGSPGAGNLQQTIGQVLGDLGKAGGAGSPGRTPGAGDMASMAKDVLTRVGGGSAGRGALAAGGILALLLGTKQGRKLGSSALKLGGLAAIGGLAYKAWQDYQAGRPPLGTGPATTDTVAPLSLAPPGSPFGADPVAMLALRAMISAAKADGHVDPDERMRILNELAQGGADTTVQRFFDEELARPLDLDALAAEATTPELATQLYAASLIAIDPDTDAEKAYLSELATRLKLDTALKSHLESTVAAAKAI